MNSEKSSSFSQFKNWTEASIGSDCTIKGRIGWKGYTTSDLRESGPIVIGGTEINSDYVLNLENVKHLSIEKYEESPEIMLQEGDVLIVTRGNLADIGYFDGSIEQATINPSVIILSEYVGNPKFLFYFLCSYYGRKLILSVESGTTIPAIYQKDVKKLKYSRPPLHIQDKIVQYINKLDILIMNQNSISNIASEMISSLFRSWFVDFDPVKAKAEGKLPYGMDEETAALFPDTFEDSELGRIPAGWRVSSVSKICKMSSGGTPSRSKEEYFSTLGDGYPWLASRKIDFNILHDTEEYISELGLKNSSAKLFPENTVVLAMYGGGTVGRCGFLGSPMTTSQAICGMIAKDGFSLPKYLYFLIECESPWIVWMYAVGGAQVNLSQQSIGTHRVVLPLFEIIQKFESLVDELFAKIDISSIQSEKLSEIRDALLPRLMSGELKGN